jgi:hypothetical protein
VTSPFHMPRGKSPIHMSAKSEAVRVLASIWFVTLGIARLVTGAVLSYQGGHGYLPNALLVGSVGWSLAAIAWLPPSE